MEISWVWLGLIEELDSGQRTVIFQITQFDDLPWFAY